MSLKEGVESSEIEEVYSVIGNPIKRKIVELLAERGAVPFSELKRELNLSVGTLYYNLDGLRDLITKDDARRYRLTERGYHLYQVMREGDEAIKRALQMRRKRIVILDHMLKFLVPQQLIISLYKNTKMSLITLSTCLIAGILVVKLTKLPLKLIEVEQVPVLYSRSLSSIVITPEALLFFDYFISFLAILTIILILGRLLTGLKAQPLGVAAGVALAKTPLISYMLLHYTLTGLNYPEVPWNTMVLLAVALRLLQVLSLGILTATVATFFRTNFERGFLVASMIFYLSFTLKIFIP